MESSQDQNGVKTLESKIFHNIFAYKISISRKFIKQDATAVEVAIAILACECVASPENTGFGGGFVAMIYRQKTGTVETLIATESSYIAELPDEDPIHTVGVPGMLKGLWEMYKRYETSTSWSSLMKESYALAKEYAKGGNQVIHPQLLETIEVIMYNEPKEFYEGDLGDKFIKDIRSYGGTMHKSDLQGYR